MNALKKIILRLMIKDIQMVWVSCVEKESTSHCTRLTKHLSGVGRLMATA